MRANGSSGRLPATANSFSIITLAGSAVDLVLIGLSRRRDSKPRSRPCTKTSLVSVNTSILAKIHSTNSSRNNSNASKMQNNSIRTSEPFIERRRIKMEVVKSIHFISKEAARIHTSGKGKPRKISLENKVVLGQRKMNTAKANTVSFNETCMICFIGSRGSISNDKSSISITVNSSNNTKVNTAKEKVMQTHLNRHLNNGIQTSTFMIQCTQQTF